MGIASMVIGIVCIVFTFIIPSIVERAPNITVIIMIPAIIAVVLGIVEIVKKKKQKKFALTGVILGSIAIILASIISMAFFTRDFVDMSNSKMNSHYDKFDSYKNRKTKQRERTQEDNPILGKWTPDKSGAGYFVFKEHNEFYWYQSKSNLADNYYHGRYYITKGAQQNSGKIDYGTTGYEVYTINLKYDNQIVNGKKRQEQTKGSLLSKDRIQILNFN